ncbi:methyltransferase domain-containing protein [Paenibacillus aurantius]|uniref:Methyltransferase domain-containing protein n=1 Tax=Paenibacillus aurantius TaxID=2918900 RepID=A0AA96RHS5_9BACL|nr:methyltransferase domain-containing protein [Paenibacillus aurantius]WNQ13856.1 methyltransferase domain-containing protein [Paenibacillus aurantius]
MFSFLDRRAEQPELMDDLRAGGPELEEALVHLRRLNRIFHAAGPLLYGVDRLWREAGKPARLTVLDAGCGSGEGNRRVLQWADSRGVDVRVTLVDRSEEACTEAARLFRYEPRVQVRQGDLFGLSLREADIVTAGQVFHHFGQEELPAAARALAEASTIGTVIHDIHRHWIAWCAVWLTARLVSRNRYIRHDGPLSVHKGFREGDWKKVGDELAGYRLTCSWRPLFRYAVLVTREPRSL